MARGGIRLKPIRPWTDGDVATLVELYQQGQSNVQIAQAISRSVEAIGGKLRVLRATLPKRTKAQRHLIYRWRDHSQDEEFFDEPKAKAEREAIAKEFRGRELRILVLSDIHGLFRHHQVLEEADKAITAHRLNLLVIPGDVLDQHAASRFVKYKHLDMQDEVAEMARVLKHFSKRVPRVVITQGNHDMRAARLIAQQVPQLSAVLKDATNFLGQCAEGLTNVTPMESWWVKIGDVVFCHREKYTKQERTSGESNLRYFENRGVEDIGLVVQGHVHRTCLIPLKRNTWYMESPMCAYRADYTYESRSLDAILVTGYAIVHINKDGKADINRTRPYFVSWE